MSNVRKIKSLQFVSKLDRLLLFTMSVPIDMLAFHGSFESKAVNSYRGLQKVILL
jgi:hypothetical protein